MATDINIKQSRYEETRRRITRFKNQFNISDREIIEYLAEEIEQYREKIKILEQNNKEIYSERSIYSCGIDGGDKDYTVTRWYEDGVLIKEQIDPCK